MIPSYSFTVCLKLLREIVLQYEVASYDDIDIHKKLSPISWILCESHLLFRVNFIIESKTELLTIPQNVFH